MAPDAAFPSKKAISSGAPCGMDHPNHFIMNSTRDTWHRIGPVEELKKTELQEVRIGGKAFALSCRDGKFGAVGGPGRGGRF